MVSTLHFVLSPTGFGRVKVVFTLGTGRPKRPSLRHRGLSPVDGVPGYTTHQRTEFTHE